MKQILLVWVAVFSLIVGATETGPANSVLRVPPGGGRAKMGSITLSSAAAVTGTLPLGNGGTGQTSFPAGVVQSNGSALSSGTLSVANGGTGSVSIAAGAVSSNGSVLSGGTLTVANGGTGVGTISGLVFGNGTSAFSNPTNLSWDNASFRLGLGPTSVFLARKSSNSIYITNNALSQSLPIVTSADPSTNGLKIVRGSFQTVPSGASCGTQRTGEGFTCARSGIGVYDITFTNAFTDNPACSCVSWGSGAAQYVCALNNDTTATAQIHTLQGGGILADSPISFICIGQRSP